ncbi:uncharacterized protein LOC116337594 [Contarinia nasturtii]|uniref:uncharacterized protein LOC116337594 n=1 Tax=Contarinia nasturtii TaxID=265458 RepID=UPI0012D38632|nr:uncharacterized protein LOC116337594 [Contarinia nasturtii]
MSNHTMYFSTTVRYSLFMFIFSSVMCVFARNTQGTVTNEKYQKKELNLWDLAVQRRKLQLQGVAPIVVLENGKLVRKYVNRNSPKYEPINTTSHSGDRTVKPIVRHENISRKKEISNRRRGKSMRFNESDDEKQFPMIDNRMLNDNIDTAQRPNRKSLISVENLTHKIDRVMVYTSSTMKPLTYFGMTTLRSTTEHFASIQTVSEVLKSSQETTAQTIKFTTTIPQTTTSPLEEINNIDQLPKIDTESTTESVDKLNYTNMAFKYEMTEKLPIATTEFETINILPTSMPDIETAEVDKMSSVTMKNIEQDFTGTLRTEPTTENLINIPNDLENLFRSEIISTIEPVTTAFPATSSATDEMIELLRTTTARIGLSEEKNDINPMDYLADVVSIPFTNVPTTAAPSSTTGEMIEPLRETNVPITTVKSSNDINSMDYITASVPFTNVPTATASYSTIEEIISTMHDIDSIDFVDAAAVSASVRNVVPSTFLTIFIEILYFVPMQILLSMKISIKWMNWH